MNNDNTANGVLALTSSDITVANTRTLTLASTNASTGIFDVVGSVKRNTPSPLSSGVGYTFGNPNNVITFTAAGTRPTDLTINLVKAAPSGAIDFPTAVNRTYTITPTGGVGFSATVQLHYLSAELNGNTEGAGLNLWRFNGVGWAPIGQTANSTTPPNNWVSKAGVTAFSPWTFNSTVVPTAANGVVSGQITIPDGAPVAGAVVNLSGNQSRKTITDAHGSYRFDNVETSGFYTVTPSRANFVFSPAQRSFNQLGNNTEASFTGAPGTETANPLDTPEYFVRQQYVDLLGREPEEDGFNYWSDRILECGGDGLCVKARRRDVAAAFFIEAEFQQTGSFIYGLYKASLGRTPAYAEFSADRQQVIGGPNLETMKQAFAESFIGRAEVVAKYQANTTAESFVNALLENVQQASGIDLSSQRDALTARYNTGANLNESRSLVVRELTASADFRQAEYNRAFVLTEYFGYLRRDAEPEGYNFWLDVLNNREPGNFRGMVCSFITSREYQQRFSVIVSHSNQECGQ
jgi:carboxypeptidase family protein